MTDYFWVTWVILGLVLLGVELHQQQFYALFVAVASFAAALVDLAGQSLWWQGIAFAVVAFVGLAGVRRVVVRRFHRPGDALVLPGIHGGFVGQSAITADTVGDEHHPGHAVLAGEQWLAITDIGSDLAPQTPVIVAGMRGTTLLVRPAK